MKEQVYQWITRRAPAARDRYEALRRRGMSRRQAFPVLVGGVASHLLRGSPVPDLGSGKQLPSGGSESAQDRGESPKALVRRLEAYGVISFDVFDTLLLRRVDRPETVFALVGAKLGYPDFARLRGEAEQAARRKKRQETGTAEVTLGEIWNQVSRRCALDPDRGMALELETERALCRGNPYFLPVVEQLRAQGKELVLLSDMYLPGAFLQQLLEEQGFGRFSRCWVSGEAGVSKGEGGLFALLREAYPHKSWIHVGDNPQADGAGPGKQGGTAFLYPNVHTQGEAFRAEDMSCLVGSVYRGLVNGKLHNGSAVYSPLYEYGFVYGGLFALGYCRFLREQAQAQRADRLLFLSRDGAVLLRLYRRLYREDARPVYAYWSRLAAAKVCAGLFPADYFRRFLLHKADGSRSLKQILRPMELECFLPGLCKALDAGPETPLTHKNVPLVEQYLQGVWDQVLKAYEGQRLAAERYYRQLLQGCARALAVDIGWAGSGPVSLGLAVQTLWRLPCQVRGVVAGTNSLHSPERDGSEPLLLTGQLQSYLFSQAHNRDLWKFHNPRQGHNLFWELLLGAREGSLRGFYPQGEGFRLEFLPHPHGEAVEEIHRGVLEFAEEWLETERRLGLTLPISGRDAYAPLLEALARQNGPCRRSWEGYLDAPDLG